MPRSLWASLLLSLILHLTALFLVDRLFLAEREVRAFRARLATAPRFVPQYQKLISYDFVLYHLCSLVLSTI